MLELWESVFGATQPLHCFSRCYNVKHSNKKKKKKNQGCCPFIFVSIKGGSEIYEGDKQLSRQQREPFYQS